MAPVDPDEELPDAADLGEPPPLDEVMDDLAMSSSRTLINLEGSSVSRGT